MMESERRAVYCTLLLSDNYLPGAMILAHSLRDNGTKARLVALFTPDTLQTATVNELRTVYDELIPVRELVNGTPANLWLMNRPDLIATFTKIELWRLTQFDRIVYIDCDVLASRAPDELLSLEVDFAAVPDVGWPDIFNSGLMVLRPNMQDYYALKALAERGISFDGADQGLLNMHFRDWHRLSFTYNCTPSANYQYIPAYRHFQSTISLIHFIGSQKPWNLPRQVVPQESPYNQLLGQWWAVYDRHYRPPFVSIRPPPQSVQQETYSAKAPTHEQWPEPYHVHHVKEHAPVSFHRGVQRDEDVAQLVSMTHEQTQPWQPSHNPDQGPATSRTMPVLSAVPQYVRGEEHVSTFIPPLPHIPASVFHALQQSHEGWQEPPKEQEHPQEQEHHQQEHHDQTHDAGHIYQPQPSAPTPPLTQLYQPPRSPSPQPPTFEAPKAEWDASREPPPLNTKPEGISLQERTYSMSEDTNLFRPPPSYPEAPKNMYYQVPETKPEPQKVTKLFPWESHAPKPTRVFAQELPVPTVSSEDQSTPTQIKESDAPPETPTLRSQYGSPTESWDTYTRSNVWDEDPHIQKYIESMQQVRHGRTQVISGSSQSSTSQGSASSSFSGRRPSIKLTDFPTAVERPSLPVTPAPVQPGAHEEASAEITLPTAEGVPDQEDWNPLARLEELRRRQSAVLESSDYLHRRPSQDPASTEREGAPDAGDGSGQR